LPPLLTHSAPLWGRSAWPPARWRRRVAPATSRGSGAGHSPGERERKRRGAVCPPSAHAQGAQVGPLVARGRRHTAGGARIWGGAGHPKREGKGRGFGFGEEEISGGGGDEFGGDLRWWRRNWGVWEEEEMYVVVEVVFGWRRRWWLGLI